MTPKKIVRPHVEVYPSSNGPWIEMYFENVSISFDLTTDQAKDLAKRITAKPPKRPLR